MFKEGQWSWCRVWSTKRSSWGSWGFLSWRKGCSGVTLLLSKTIWKKAVLDSPLESMILEVFSKLHDFMILGLCWSFMFSTNSDSVDTSPKHCPCAPLPLLQQPCRTPTGRVYFSADSSISQVPQWLQWTLLCENISHNTHRGNGWDGDLRWLNEKLRDSKSPLRDSQSCWWHSTVSVKLVQPLLSTG